MAKTTKEPQWPDCPDKERAKVPGINLAIKDMTNPCKLAKLYGVRLGQLRAFTVSDPASVPMVRLNDFIIARTLKHGVNVMASAKKEPQWPDCPDRERAKVPGINLAIRDMENPCKLAKQYGVRLGQ